MDKLNTTWRVLDWMESEWSFYVEISSSLHKSYIHHTSSDEMFVVTKIAYIPKNEPCISTICYVPTLQN